MMRHRLILDEGSENALLIEHRKAEPHAIIKPVNQYNVLKALSLRKMKMKAGYIAVSSMWLLTIFILLSRFETFSSSMSTTNLVALFAFSGLGLGGCVFLRYAMKQAFHDDEKNLLVGYALRELRLQGTKEEYYIPSSYMYHGTEGDFITFYKQEKFKKVNK